MNRKSVLLFVLSVLTSLSSQAINLPDSTAADPKYPMADYTDPKPYVVNNITVHGVKYLDPASLMTTAGLVKGDTVLIPGNYVSQAVNNLMSRRYFSNATVVAEPVGDSINLEIYLLERPRVYRWEFEGLRKGETNDVKEKLKLRPGSELSDYTIEKNINFIKNYLADKAFRNARVDVRIENDTLYQNAVNVTFLIDKGGKVKIGEVNFEGNEVFTDKRLRRTFKKTSPKNLNLFKSSKFKEKEYEEDKEKLIDFYNSRGYRNAHVVKDSIYTINPKRIGIDVTVDEGNKFYFRNISWVGNSKVSTEELNIMLGIQPGDTYDRKSLHKRLGIGLEGNPEDMSITSLYQNDGYLFFRIEPSEIIIGADSIDLEIKMFEGRQATLNNIIITGNTLVDDEVIRRELYTRPGELYDRSLLMSTMRQLAQMQHFNPEAIAPGINPITSELVDITWNLEETASDNFEISGGWGAGMFVFSIGINLNNLSLKNFFNKEAWKPYPRGQNQQLSLRAQSNGSYYKAFSLAFTEPWLGGRKPVSLTLGAHYSDETDAIYFLGTGTKHFRTFGVSVGMGRRLNWPDPYWTLYNELSYQAYNLKDWDSYFVVSNGTSNIISFRTVFGRSSVDQPIYPRRGSEFSISLALTPPYSLFDNRDYSDPNMSENVRYGWIEYHKWNLKGQWFTPLSANTKLVLMAKAEMGYLGHYNKNKTSPFEGFDMGGSGMTGYNIYGVDVIGLRGYDEGDITPNTNGDYAHVYNKYTVELRYPIILQPATQIYGLVFAEAGNAFESWKKFNPFELKRSVGVGLRLNLQIVGMLGVDWGFGFDKVGTSKKRNGGQFGFVFGQQF